MIRIFEEGDRATFIDMAMKFYRSKAVMHEVPEAYFAYTFDTILAGSPYARGLMILGPEGPVGYGLLSITYSNEVGGVVLWIEEVYVLHDYRGKGYGKEFFQYVEREYAGIFRRFRLEVAPSNTRAKRLYEQLGYQTLEYAQMVKELDPEEVAAQYEEE